MWAALVFATLIFVWLAPSLWMRRRSWALTDVFLLAIAMNFGAFVLLDAVAGEPQRVDALSALCVFASAAIAAVIIRAFPSVPLNDRDWLEAPAWPLIVVIGCAVAYRWYTAQYFADFALSDLADAERDLPYWYTAAGMLVSTTLFGAAIAAWAKWHALRSWFWASMTVLCAALMFGMGRRALLAYLIVIGWTLLRKRGLKALAVLALAAPILVVLSNLYQAYRVAAHRGVIIEDVVDASVLDTAFAWELTASNLKERQPMWRFNHAIVDAHLEDRGRLQLGALLLGDFKNYVPSVLSPGKEWVDSEATMLEAFGLEVLDGPGNLFAYTYADFGMLNGLATAAYILGFAGLVGFALRHLRDPFLRTLLTAMAIYYALQLETGYLVPLAIARDFILMATLYVAIRSVARLFRSSRAPGRDTTGA